MSEPKATASRSSRNHFIDLLKGICIIFVIVTHFSWRDEEKLQYYFPYWLNMAVPIFMIISGYVYAFSFRKHKIETVSDAYSLKCVVPKIVRYTVPFAIAYIIEIVYMIMTGRFVAEEGVILNLVSNFIVGGYGPGSYYFPLMIQFIFVYPIIYFIVRKHDFKGVIIVGVLNAIFELIQYSYHLSYSSYRLLILRYILLIAVGCHISREDFKMRKVVMIISFVVGALFIYKCNFMEYEPRIITHWTKTSYLACLYILPIATIMILKLKSVRFIPLEFLGKASYNIFLAQMVWYHFGFKWLGTVVEDRLMLLAVDILICIIAGILFYFAEQPVTRFVDKQVAKLIK